MPAKGSCYVRDRIALLLDDGTFVEDGQLANAQAAGLPADGVVTGQGLVDGRPALVVANDPTVKAGSWGARTVEKIIRITERALVEELPVFWLIDSAGARITDQVALVPRPAWRGPHLSQPGHAVRQGAADLLPVRPVGGWRRLHPELLRRRDHGRGQRVDVSRLAPDGRDGRGGEASACEEMGGARMHATVSGCGDNLAVDDEDAIEQAKLFFSYLPDVLARATARRHAERAAVELADDAGARRTSRCPSTSTR